MKVSEKTLWVIFTYFFLKKKKIDRDANLFMLCNSVTHFGKNRRIYEAPNNQLVIFKFIVLLLSSAMIRSLPNLEKYIKWNAWKKLEYGKNHACLWQHFVIKKYKKEIISFFFTCEFYQKIFHSILFYFIKHVKMINFPSKSDGSKLNKKEHIFLFY